MTQASFLAIIPARGGSKALPRKSLLPIGEHSLIGHAITGARASGFITRTLFSSDHAAMMAEAKRYGAEVPFQRPPHLATDTAGSWSVVCHAIDWLQTHENWVPDFVVLLQPTTPFRTAQHIDAAISGMQAHHKTSCISVREVDYPPQWMFTINDNCEAAPLLPNAKPISRRQDATQVWQPNGLIYVIASNQLTQTLRLPHPDTHLHKMNWQDSINIDNAWQYDMAVLTYAKMHGLEVPA